MLNIIIKVLLAALLLYVIYNLFRGLFSLLRQGNDGEPRMSYFIGRRVALSALVIVLILIALATGIITPHPRPY